MFDCEHMSSLIEVNRKTYLFEGQHLVKCFAVSLFVYVNRRDLCVSFFRQDFQNSSSLNRSPVGNPNEAASSEQLRAANHLKIGPKLWVLKIVENMTFTSILG